MVSIGQGSSRDIAFNNDNDSSYCDGRDDDDVYQYKTPLKKGRTDEQYIMGFHLMTNYHKPTHGSLPITCKQLSRNTDCSASTSSISSTQPISSASNQQIDHDLEQTENINAVETPIFDRCHLTKKNHTQ